MWQNFVSKIPWTGLQILVWFLLDFLAEISKVPPRCQSCLLNSWGQVLFRMFKASLTFKCMTEHLFADFSCSIALDTYLWKQMMQMNRKLIHIWYNVDKKHLLFTRRKCHKFSWLFTASRCSPRKRSICACRIACKVLVSIGLYSLSFGFLKQSFLLGKPCL